MSVFANRPVTTELSGSSAKAQHRLKPSPPQGHGYRAREDTIAMTNLGMFTVLAGYDRQIETNHLFCTMEMLSVESAMFGDDLHLLILITGIVTES